MLTRKQIKKRFNELVVREALGQLSTAEKIKLDRYQELLRLAPTSQQKRTQARNDYILRVLLKELGAAQHLVNS